MRFVVDENSSSLDGKLMYRTEEYSFDFVPVEKNFSTGGITLMIKTLQIEMDVEKGILLYPWGLQPYQSWERGILKLPSYSKASIKVVLDKSIPLGSTRRIGSEKEWNTIFDSHSGWLCIYRDNKFSEYKHVEFATNVILGLMDESIYALWLKPEISSVIPTI